MGKVIVLMGILLAIVALGGQAQELNSTLNMLYIQDTGYHPDDLNMLTRVFKDLTGTNVNIEMVRYEEYYERLLTSAAAYDVCAVDQIWIADLVTKGLLFPLNDFLSREIRKDLAPGLKNAFVYQEQTWGLPFLVNIQLFFYNAHLLKEAGFNNPPGSLEAMIEQMEALKKQGVVEYPWTDAWQQTESLVLDFVWVLGAFEGELFDQEGRVAFDQEAGVKALEFMQSLLEKGLASPAILDYDELSAKDDFLSGRAAFTSNWVFLQGLLNESPLAEAGKMGMLPASKFVPAKTSSVISTQGLAISAQSARKEAAWQWMQFFTSPLVQRAFVLEMPIWSSVQTSPDVTQLDPQMLVKRDQLLNAILRPNIPDYEEFSAILQKALHQALLGNMEPSEALQWARAEFLQMPAK
jgi:multiple sugar transport system substrate-binding protein